MSPLPPPRILIIRRDNIGDLVCTTPLIRALRQRFPDAWLGALVNSYNAPVLAGNPDLDAVFVYTKAKHRQAGESLLGVHWRRLLMLRSLRSMGLDDIIVATPLALPRIVKLARWLRPKRVIAFGQTGADVALPLNQQGSDHEVEDVFRIARCYGIEGPPPPCRMGRSSQGNGPVAIHISARKPSQRWPAERFASLMQTLRAQQPSLRFRLLWAPGAENDPRHPGDDAKAAAILAALGADFPVEPVPTQALAQLIDALAGCSAMICADGGAMHLGAGVGLPIVCLFGDSGAERWRPWGVPYRLLQKPSRQVMDVAVAEVASAYAELIQHEEKVLPSP